MPSFKKINEQEEEAEKILQEKPDSEKTKSSFNPTKIGQSLRKINPKKHYQKHVHKRLKGSMKWMLWITKKVQSRGAAFPLFLVLVNTLYLVLGGLLFMLLEKQPPVKINPSNELAEIFNILKNSNVGSQALPDFKSGSAMVSNLTSSDIDRFENVLERINSERVAASKPEWTVLNSIFFCMTVTTTIGYGHLAPVTTFGRMICVIYALLGIPLTLALMAVIGKLVGDSINHACSLFLKWLQRLYPKYEYESNNPDNEDGEIDAPLWLGLLILFLFTAITAALHCWMEGWDFGTAFYFQYVTYLTIGFGDVVPDKPKFVFIDIFLTFLGLAVLSVTLSLIASNLHHQMQKTSFLENLMEDELSDASSVTSDQDIENNGKNGKRKKEEESAGITSSDSSGGKSYGTTQP
ncbi:potassium channel subfamily K member 18-like [Actinia tenebrosa]|uniref:Potassium channel subfamily K member 18-like n=1 Tax=Actinia tenebrosa TaxID=6105 RepID=A0A6P8HFM8_ACTTE|nr:potassium channel subfamily K member 18-like [Actinia tenebrosa]